MWPGKEAQKEAGGSSRGCPPRSAGLMNLTAPGSGAGSLPLLLALGLVILHCVVADGNSTRSPENDGLLCGDAREDCAVTTTQSKWNDHLSPCPENYVHYCIKGKCRFVEDLQTPSCLCDVGYTGMRCEKVDIFYLRGDTGRILVICLTAVMVTLIILVIGVCTYCHPLRKKKKEDMPNLDKDITPVNEDIQETSIV